MKRKDIELLWKEDGDLDLMKSYFQQIKTDIDQKERIKKMTLEKISKDETEQIIETPRLKIGQHVRSWHWRFGWKLVVPAALVLLVFFGIWGLSEPLNPKTSHQNTSTSIASTSKGTSSENMPALGAPAAEPNFSKGESQYSSDSSRQAGSMGIAADTAVPPDQGGINGNAISITPVPGPVPPEPGNEAPPADTSLPRKVTYNLDLSLRVEDISKVLDQIRQQVGQVNGYVIDSQQSGQDVNSYGNITVKIPANQLDVFRAYLENLGTVLNSHTSSNDITNQYYDTQTRLTNWEAQEQRYLEILKQAKTVEEILQVENQLNNVRQQIESLKGQMKLWNNEVDYSRVQVSLEKVVRSDIQVKDPWQPVALKDTWKAAKQAVLKTLSSTWNFLNYIVVGIGYALPYIILLGIVYIAYRIWKKRK